jgi:sodium/hydrogen exchanger-like protein 6/7
MMLFWAGLRGAVAFALASSLTGESGSAMRTTILAVVVLTVLIFGGTTNRMLQVLEIKTGVVEPDDSCSDDEEDVDPQQWSSQHARARRRQQRQLEEEGSPQRQRYQRHQQQHHQQRRRSSEEHLLNMEENGNSTDDDLEEEDYMLQPSQRRYQQEQMDVSIGGLLSGPLGAPIPEPDQPHWFMSFDEKWIKPLLTKKHVQARNQTLAEYWRDKRKKMERANQNMLAGIRGMHLQPEQDAVTLKSVHGATSALVVDEDDDNDSSIFVGGRQPDINEWEQQAADRNIFGKPSTNNKLVIGAGRVFGRSPSSPPDG